MENGDSTPSLLAASATITRRPLTRSQHLLLQIQEEQQQKGKET